ncbi:hypothetical protein AMAG_18202 [Allomyces macrogynus ATCC 38327]|uniref:Cytochrome P450 n=1 Tax=Allomyces macrogynus (strain ATCC 38327) TaxID=578462 RepID=A0A0L0SAY3_ALLM3|nr:hypothetical protein AMAG_18202 [Allomyces macrogynus ATCC 38327]|eukprot:KNE59545.1 hypothetical protein AMAG_18202 [Allomyces macrogynus ATCC 38327]
MAANGTPLTESPESIAGSSPTKPIVATTPPSPTAPNAPPTRHRSASDAPAVAAAGALRTSGAGGSPRSRRGTSDGSPGPHPIVAGSSGRSSVVSFGPMASTGLAGSVSVAAVGPGPARSSSAAAAAGSSPVVAAAAAKVRRHTVTAQDAAGIATAASSIVAAGGDTPQVSNVPRMSMSRKMSTRFGHRIDQNHEKYAFIFFMLTGIRLSDLQRPLFQLMPFLQKVKLIPLVRDIHRRIDEFDEFVEGVIKAKEAEVKQRLGAGTAKDEKDRDLVECIIEAATNDPEGHDTTASSLHHGPSYYLALHPEVQTKARAEVLFGPSGDVDNTTTTAADFPVPTTAEQAQFDYLTCIIKEALRLYPAVTGLPLRRTAKPITMGNIACPLSVLG